MGQLTATNQEGKSEVVDVDAVVERIVADVRRRAWMERLLSLPHCTQVAYLEALIVERSYREASIELGGNWPEGQCAEASCDLAEILRLRIPRAKPSVIWGRFEVLELKMPHAWVELRDGTIIDVTAGQFFRGETAKRESTWLVLPDDAIADRYVPEERDPRWSRW